ncbi:uncharacterized protein RHO25_012966 [Cercospora beticola]|uniref:Uncharacterized protein n=1 Tax=Cercospora beticola TaxID=122368 RepID=A0ABZ0P961_CERBT|nr:hypothetical protein RHO25_012966 [Cercospora beticola]CAK1367818.1 unnamed protein product [Cercospora beticola]
MLSLCRFIANVGHWLSGADRDSSTQLDNAPWKFPASNTSFHPANDLGPYFLELFDQLYGKTAELADCKRQKWDCDGRFHDRQKDLDLAQSDVNLARKNMNYDFTELVERAQEMIQRESPQQTEEEATAAQVEARISGLESDIFKLWCLIFRHTQEYVQKCLDTYFEAQWSLSHGWCIDLCTMMYMHNLTQERKHDLRALKVERAFSRHQNDGAYLETDIKHAERILEGMEGRRRRFDDRFMNMAVKKLLIAAGRLQLAEDSPDRPRSINPAESFPRSEIDAPDARSAEERYLEARDDLIEFQEDLQRKEFALRTDESQHMLVFPRSSPARFDALVRRKVQHVRAKIEEAQGRLQEAASELAQLGRDIPSLTGPSDTHSRRESRPRSGSRMSRENSQGHSPRRSARKRAADGRAKRDYINRWQISSKPDGYAMASGTPPPDLVMDDISDNASRSITPSPEQTSSSTKRRKLK